MGAAPTPMQRAQQNAMARSIVLANSIKMVQSIGSQSVDVANQNVINFQPRNVGLTMGFLLVVSANVSAAAVDCTLSPFGPANLVNQVTYTDLQNLQRIQTTGAHLALLNSARQGFAFGGAYQPGIPLGYGNHFDVFDGADIDFSVTPDAKVKVMLWVPLAYSSTDLRGAVYTNVVNATQNLQVVLNQTPFNAAGTDKYGSVYYGGAGDYDGNATVEVYQVYRDQIPFQNGIPVLPIDDLNIVYDIKNTNLGGLTAGADNPFAYPNMRQFLSTLALFKNGATIGYGADVNYWSIESANSTQLLKATPDVVALFARQTFMADPPAGAYYFDHRDKPIDTITFGNMTLNLNPSVVNANASLGVYTEAFQQVNQIPYAASLSIA